MTEMQQAMHSITEEREKHNSVVRKLNADLLQANQQILFANEKILLADSKVDFFGMCGFIDTIVIFRT